MAARESLGGIAVAVLEAAQRGALHSRRAGAEPWLHEALRDCEHEGLLRSRRDRAGRRYELTAAGRAQLRADRRLAAALARLIARSRP